MSLLYRFFTLLFQIHLLSALTINNGLAPSAMENTTVVVPPRDFNTTYPLTDHWGALCHRIYDHYMDSLDPTSCDEAARQMCEHLGLVGPVHLVYNRWTWFELPGCAMAFYYPTNAYGPVMAECPLITKRILEKCSRNRRFNAGSSNVEHLPDYTQDGVADDPRYAMFLMAPWSFTL